MARAIEVRLKVALAYKEDVYKDVVRIHRQDRGFIREGRICAIAANGRTKPVVVRGIEGDLSGIIMMDGLTRDAFGVHEDLPYDFVIKEAGLGSQLWWACSAAEPGARIAAWIGVLSLLLGALALVAALAPLISR